MSIYGSPSYQMGDIEPAATAVVTKAQAVQAKAELARMRKVLAQWLRFRAINDQVASGQGARVPDAALKRPGLVPPPAAVVRAHLTTQRQHEERSMALHLHHLLSEVFDAGSLPSPDQPDAVVKLAQIAVAGKLPGETPQPTATGFVWLWPAVIVVGGIVMVLATKIRSDAQTAMEREKLECVKAGKCTDSGFWLKVGAVGFLGWLAWDKAGLGERVKALGRKRR